MEGIKVGGGFGPRDRAGEGRPVLKGPRGGGNGCPVEEARQGGGSARGSPPAGGGRAAKEDRR